MKKKPSTVEAFVNCLEKSGVKHAFGFPGETTLPLYIAYKKSEIDHIMAGCERCAGYMADVYSRLTNTIGVVDAPGGIGTPWLMPAIVEARNSSIPLLAVTSKLRPGATGEFDQAAMFKPVVNAIHTLNTPESIYDDIQIMLAYAMDKSLSPVFFEIPTEMMDMPVDQDEFNSNPIRYPTERIAPEQKGIDQVLDAIKEARQPIILAGGGIWLSLANQELATFSDKFKIPVATTINGKGAIDEESELCLGVVGNKGSKEANDFFKKSDLVIIIGSKCGDKSTDKGRLLEGKKVVRVDANEDLLSSNNAEINLACDAREFLSTLHQYESQGKIDKSILEQMAAIKRQVQDKFTQFESLDLAVSPSQIIKSINSKFNGDAIICADASVSSGWAGALGLSKGQYRNVITPRGTGSLGFGLPATIGAKIACPDKHVFGIGGDGGFAMSCHEIETACRLGLDFHYFILRNNALGLLESHLKRVMHQPYPILNKRHDTDWEAITNGFGAKSVTLETNGDVVDYFNDPPNGTNVVQVCVNQNILAPDFETRINR